jgi:hypothetical protein
MWRMKTTVLLALVFAAVAAPTFAPTANDGRVFELRTYHTPPGKLDALNARFRDHTIQLFKHHGMDVVGFWEPTDPKQGAGETLVYILAHKNRAAADASWSAFRADPEWVRVKADSEKDGSLTTKVESVFMSATDYSPMK